MPVKPAFLLLAGAGAIVGVAGLKGWGVGSTIRDVIAGHNPNIASLTNQITGSSGYGYSGNLPPPVVSGDTFPPIPYLGTTLPPISTMIKYFGPQADMAYETNVNFAGFTCTINKVLAQNLYEAGQAIIQAGLQHEIQNVGGFRTAIGGSGAPIPFSMHNFGAAIDINEQTENWHTMQLDPRLVNIMASYRWFCGENWGGISRDGGHFQYEGGTNVIAQVLRKVKSWHSNLVS
jgi:D-alanyl-D-alanine carboxypeptidase